MGLVSGVLLEKSKSDRPSELNDKLDRFVNRVPRLAGDIIDYTEINTILEKMGAELDQLKPALLQEAHGPIEER